MNKQYLKQEWFLTKEVLPSEVPTFFSNSPLKDNLEKLINLALTDGKEIKKILMRNIPFIFATKSLKTMVVIGQFR